MKKTKKKLPLELIAVRRGNREAEREVLGDGFHSRTHIKRSRKLYTRHSKHRLQED